MRETRVLLECTGDPAFASDEQGRIVGWNAAAERLLGYPAESVLGKPCCEITCGMDLFGNLFCREECNLRGMIHRHKPVRSFEMRVRNASGRFLRVACSVLVIRTSGAGQFSIFHILRPAADTDNVHADLVPTREPHSRPSQEAVGLTRREIEVLWLISEGYGTRQIADSLFISPNTVRTHVQSILRKLEVHTKTQAVALARRLHLI